MRAHRENEAFGSYCHVFDSYIEFNNTVYNYSAQSRDNVHAVSPSRGVTYATKGVKRLNIDDPMTQMTHDPCPMPLAGSFGSSPTMTQMTHDLRALAARRCAATEACDLRARDNVTI